MYGIRDVLQAGQDFLAQPQLTVEGDGTAVDGSVCQGSHTYATTGHSHVVVLEFLCGTEILAHGFKGSRTDGSVAKGQRTYCNWSE